jgi:phospholipid/cholesterol/gamma-HCH transport system ATP-binding protein
LLRPDSGTVNVLGKEVSRLEERQLNELRLQLGFSFQNSALYDSMSVKENLLFPLNRHRPHFSRAEAMKSIDSVLDAVGLLRAKNQMPTELSGGQKKRIGIARTLILQPKVMLYDEPTAGLDPITSTEINELITEVREKYGTSSIIITHDLTCAKDTGDRVAMLLEGVFAKVGTFADVFGSEDERIKSFYNYNFTQ